MDTKNLINKVVKDRIDEWKPVIAKKNVFCSSCNRSIKKGTKVFWNFRTKKIKHQSVCINPFDQMVGKEWKKGKQENLGKDSYLDYLKSLHWHNKKKKYRQSGFIQSCWACSSTKKIEFHHRTYNRLGCEAMSDIIPLCTVCHSDLTAKYKSYSGYSDTFLWEFTTEYVTKKRESLSLSPIPNNLFSVKLITQPHNVPNRCK
jgi:hypothetical protein